MRIFKGIKRVLKPLVDFPTWMGYRTLVDNGKNVIQGTKDMFTPDEAKRTETFEQATMRLNLKEADLHARQTRFFGVALLWFFAAIGVLAYAIFLISQGGFKGALLTLALSFLGFVLAFRYHFWYFQVKHRVLGTNFKTWLTSSLRIKK